MSGIFRLIAVCACLWSAWAEGLADFIDEAVAGRTVPGAVVVVQQHGRIVFNHVSGYADLESKRKLTANDIFAIASSSKPLAATTILTLVDSGKLRLDDPVSRYLPPFQGASTVRQLLCHTSGIFGNEAPAEMMRLIRTFDQTLGQNVEQVIRQPLAYSPGEKYSYGGASFCVAGRIAEMLTGVDFDAYMQRVLFDPLEMRESFYRTARNFQGRIPVLYRKTSVGFEKMTAATDAPGHRGPRADGFILVPGGIYSTPGDLIRFLQMHLDGGRWKGKQILSERMIMEMRRKHTGSLAAEYGLGWMLEKVRENGSALIFGHPGGYGTDIFVDTGKDLVAGIFTQMPFADARPFLADVRKRIEGSF